MVRIGGAGNKVLSLVDGEVDCYLFPSKGTKRWDTCAGEAILNCIGGVLTNARGERYTCAAPPAPVPLRRH